jgi:hypothetical protein
MLAIALLFAVEAGFLIGILYTSSINTQEILYLKPYLIRWAGFRRALSQGTILWTREVFLEKTESKFARTQLIPETR